MHICGDFNARVGRSTKQENEWHASLGNFGIGIRKENGLLLLEFCANNNLRICNTFFKHKFRGTWRHLRTKKWHQLDHIICRARQCNNILDCYVDTTSECWTDHQMVVLRQRIKNQMNKKIKQKHFKNSNRDIKLFPTSLIRNLTLRDETGEAIDSQLELLANDFNYLQKSITDQLEILSETVATSCSTLLKPPKRKHSFWFQDSTYVAR